MPSSWTRPPIRTAANAWCTAAGTPDISHTTSAPSPAVSARTVRTTSSRVASMVTWAPMRPASARRVAFTSDAITLAAPAARAMPTAKQPIGPHPTTKTVLPGISADNTARKALPIGSITAPTVVGMPSSGSTLVAGMAMYSANAPSRSTPMMRVFWQMWPLPVRHCRQCPHTMCPSAVTSWPTLSSVTPSPTPTISPANSWPTTRGGRMRPSAHAVQSAMCRSVPHTPACRTAMSTSLGPGDGFGTVATFRPGARCALMIACMCRWERGRNRIEKRGQGTASEYGSGKPAIHLQHRTGNITGALGREERDGGRELVRAAHASERDPRHQLPHHIGGSALLPTGARFGERGDALRGDEPRAHDVHRDPRLGDLVGQGLGKAEHARAGGRRQDQPGERLLRGHRREADDPPPRELAHQGDRGARQVHRRQQVQLDRALKRLPTLVAERRRRRAARVAEQHVEPRSEEHTSELQSLAYLVCRL